VLCHVLLGLLHRKLSVVEHAGGEHRIGLAENNSVHQMLQVSDAAAGYDRNIEGLGKRASELDIESRPGAVPVHAGQQDLSRTRSLHLPPPRDRIDSCGAASAVREYLPACAIRVRNAPGIHRDHDAL